MEQQQFDLKDNLEKVIDTQNTEIKTANDAAMNFIKVLSAFTNTYDKLHELTSEILKHKTNYYIAPATKKLYSILKDYAQLRNTVQHKYFAILSTMSNRMATEKSIKELEAKKEKEELTEEEIQTLQTLKTKLENMDELQPFKMAVQDVKQISNSISKFFHTITYKVNIKTVIKNAIRIKKKLEPTSDDSVSEENNSHEQQLH